MHTERCKHREQKITQNWGKQAGCWEATRRKGRIKLKTASKQLQVERIDIDRRSMDLDDQRFHIKKEEC